MAYRTRWREERAGAGWQSLIKEFGEDVTQKMFGRMPIRAHEYISAATGDLSPEILTQAREWATQHPAVSPVMGGEPSRGSMEFMLRQVGAGGPQAVPAQVQSMEDVMFLGMGWGFSRTEIESHLSQKAGGFGTPTEAASWLMQRYASEYGGPPPKIAGQEGVRYPAHAWRQMPGARQARARAEMAGYTPGQEYEPEQWEYPYVRRQGQSVPWSVEAVAGTWPGIPGPEPGTYMTGRAAGEAGELKLAKDIQRAGVYPEVELRRGTESIMERMAFQMGPLSQRRESGFTAPMALLGEEWLPEGAMMLPRGHYTEGTFRFSKDIFLPVGFEPEMAAEGTQWTGGKIRPFVGAAPLDLGLGRAWSSATMLSHTIAPGRKWSEKTQEWQKGQFLRMAFEVSASPEMLRLSSKTFGAKYMAPLGEASRIHGISGHGVSEVKDPTMLPVMWWAHRPEEAAAALSEMRGVTITSEQLEQMNWAEIGGDLTKYFRENVMPDIYSERRLTFDVHRESLSMLPKGRFTASGIEGQPKMARVTTDPVPMLVGEWSMMGRRGWPVRQPNIPFREMQMIEDVAQSAGAQSLVWDIQKQARPAKEAYTELISATMASKTQGYEWPKMVGQPVAIDPAAARGTLAQANLAFEEKFGGKMPTDVPEGMAILNRMIMQAAETTWGSAISLGETGVLASPKSAGFFSAQGAMEGSAVTGYISSYAGAIVAAAEGTPEEQAAAYERAITEQSNIAGGRKVLRRAMQYNIPRAVGDVLYPERALGAGEISLPEERVLKAYGVKSKEREAFVGRWKAGKLSPTALVWGHPTTGREMFARQVSILHPDVVAERGGLSGKGTPFRTSEMLAEMLGRDFDEDLLWSLMTGHLTGAGETLNIKSPGIPMATAEWVRSQADVVKSLGRSSLMPGAGLKRPPGMDEKEWAQLSGLERFQATINPDYLRKVGSEEQFGAQRALARRQKAIGVRYNILEDVIATAKGQGATGAAEHLHLAVHGRGQTPALLTPQLEKLMNYLETYTAKGGLYRRFAEPEEEGKFGAGSYAGGRGATRLQSGLMYAGLGAVTEEAITPEMFGSLFYPKGREDEGAKLARRWAKAPAGGGERGKLSKGIAEIDPEEWIRTSVIGTVGGAHMLRRAQAKGIPSRLSADTEEYLEPWKQRYAEMRAYRSKRGEIPLEERVRAAVSLHPSQEPWFGTGYEGGTLWSRLGKALLGEKGPELVEYPQMEMLKESQRPLQQARTQAAAPRLEREARLRAQEEWEKQEQQSLEERLGFAPRKFGVEKTHIMSGASMRAMMRRAGEEGAESTTGYQWGKSIYMLDPAYDERERDKYDLTAEQEFRHTAAHEAGHVYYERHRKKHITGSSWTMGAVASRAGTEALGTGRISREQIEQSYSIDPRAPYSDIRTQRQAGSELFAEQFAERLTGLHAGAYSEEGPGPLRMVVHGAVTGAGYQAGTLSSRRGQAIVGEEGPEVVDLPGGTVVHPATSAESLNAVSARAIETGQMQRFVGGGVTGPSAPRDPWEGEDPWGKEEGFWMPHSPSGPEQEAVRPRAAEPERPMYPPKVGAERFTRSLDLYIENVDKWAEQVQLAGGITEDFSADLSALTGQVLSWKTDIEKGTEYTWAGKEMQKVVRAARGVMEPGAGAGPWQALGEVQTAQQQAAFTARLGAVQGGGAGGPWGGPTPGIGWVGMRAAAWAGGPIGGEAARGAYYLPQLAQRLGGMGVPGVGALGGMAGMGIGAAIGLGRGISAATMPGDPQVQAATWQQMQAAQYGGLPGAAAQAGLGLRAAGMAMFHAPTVQRYGEAAGMIEDYGEDVVMPSDPRRGQMTEAARALMEEEGMAAGARPWMQAAGAGGIQTAMMLAQRAGQPGMTTFQQMQMQEFVSPLTQGDPVAWARYAQQGAPTTGWEAAAGVQAQGMPAGMPTPQVEQVTRGGATAWMQTDTQELWGLQEQQRQLQIEQQEFQQRQAGERLGERRFMTGATRVIQDLERASSRGFQETQFGWQAEDITRQWERGGERLGWAREDLERRRERADFGTEYQQQMLTYRYGMQQTQFGWQAQDLQRGFGRQQTQFGWQAEDLAFRGAQTTMQFGWQMEDIGENLRYATGRQRRQLLRQRERATVQMGMGMGQLGTQEERLEERRGWATEDFETEKGRLEQRRSWAQDLYNMQMEHLRKTKGWSQEDYEREKNRLDQKRSWLDEDLNRETERHSEKMARWEQSLVFEDQLRELTEAAEDKEITRQEAALEFTTHYLTEQNRIHKITGEIQKNQAVAMAAWSQFFSPGGAFRSEFTAAIREVLATFRGADYGGYKQGNPYGSTVSTPRE